MTGRGLLLLDRAVTLLLGIALVVAGAAAIWWRVGDTLLPATSNTRAATDLVARSWWPWASAAAGVVLVIVGLRWIAAHLRNRRVSRIALTGSGADGQLTLHLAHAARTAADVFAGTIGVRSAKGYAQHDRGQLVVRLDAVIEPEADLGLVAERADEVAADLGHVVGRPDLRCTIKLKVASRGRSLSRVD